MQMIQRLFPRRFVGFLSLMLLLAPVLDARQSSKTELTERVIRSQDLLGTIMNTPEVRIPTPVLAKAKAIIFVDRFQAGFIFGIKGGHGVALLHDGNGNWSPPAFYRMGGGSFGLQFGGERRESIYLIMTEEATRILTGDSGEFGVDAAIAAGPVGANADYSNISEPILVYTLASGLYAGATIQGGVISPHDDNNAVMYGDGTSALNILESGVPMPRPAEPLVETLRFYVKEGLDKEAASQ